MTPGAEVWSPRFGGDDLFQARRVRVFGSTILLAVLLMAVLTGAVPAAATGSTSEVGVDCALEFEPPELRAGAEVTEVHWTSTDELPEVDGVNAPRDSGLDVSLIGDRPGNLRVDATEALPGEWTITLLVDGEPVCEGPLYII